MLWKIATFNVNGLRARLPIVVDWLKKQQPDVLCLQETKCQDQDFPYPAFQEVGYHTYARGEKSFNGVALISKAPLAEVWPEFGDGLPDSEARLIAGQVSGIWIINTYIPQGRHPQDPAFTDKLGFFDRLRNWFNRRFRPDQPLIWTGDMNVAPDKLDVYDPEHLDGAVGFHPLERQALAEVAAWGFIDLYRQFHPQDQQFTFWDYRLPKSFARNLGWRLDHIMVTASLAQVAKECEVDVAPRGLAKPSDHTPLWAVFELEQLDPD